ncbi:MAG: 23S rRNA (guanosine(2251)-2'-O)-methyltransferase RlmB [Bifidobacteriaceae bacterium]|nr:23S rRNA (guanosine(2251)-2'-O)-methyltransferase RlmB [Bifidobacteriaceae bacterium]
MVAGNSSRRGAVRKPGTKKGPSKGSGGKGRRALRGHGPTPKAEDRPYHPAAKRKAAEQPGYRVEGRAAGPVGRPKQRAFPQRPTDENLVVGRNPVLEALRAEVPASRLEIADSLDADPRLSEILELANSQGLIISEVPIRQIDRRSTTRHQGVALTTRPYRYSKLDSLLQSGRTARQPALLVALDSVTDPHNLGAAIRSAAAFGATGLIIPERRAAAVGPGAWKASAGAAARLPIARVTNLVQALRQCQRSGCTVVGLAASGVETVDKLDVLTQPVVLVTGGEGRGLGRLVQETCDLIARIDISAATESLNASVATGIALYAAAIQRRALRA